MGIKGKVIDKNLDQERDPSFHSWKRPRIRIIIKPKNGIEMKTLLKDKRERGDGKRITISISKTRNRTARIKKRKEKGIRALFIGLNPHS